MRINQTNIATASWRAKAEVASSRSASAEENVQKMREISASKRLTADDAKNNATAEAISTAENNLVRRNGNTYSLSVGHRNSIDLQALAANQYTSSNQGNGYSPSAAGYAGRVNSRLNQDAINTYLTHQFLDKRDEIVSSFGVNEFA